MEAAAMKLANSEVNYNEKYPFCIPVTKPATCLNKLILFKTVPLI
jgi:hypothetical protein